MNHVAFIMDGNRRWAVDHGLDKLDGHKEGAKALENIVEACINRDIKYCTFYAFSTENFRRSEVEKTSIFSLVKKLCTTLQKFHDKEVCIKFIGDRSLLDSDVLMAVTASEKATSKYSKFTCIIALAYGGHNEILRAAAKVAESNLEFTTENLEANLDTQGIPHPDMIVRTGGNHRLSNFLTWQLSYSHIYFTDTYWPDFTGEHLDIAIKEYNDTTINNGK